MRLLAWPLIFLGFAIGVIYYSFRSGIEAGILAVHHFIGKLQEEDHAKSQERREDLPRRG
jgi:hypothetical protein